MNVDKMTEEDITEILQEALYEFPVEYIEFKIPDWVGILKPTHPLKKKIIDKMKETTINIDKLRDVNTLNVEIEDEELKSKYDYTANEYNLSISVNLNVGSMAQVNEYTATINKVNVIAYCKNRKHMRITMLSLLPLTLRIEVMGCR